MDISIWAIIAQIINFLILFFLFKKFLTKPISNIIQDRRVLIKKLENADKAYEDKIQKAEQEAKGIVQDWMKRKESLIIEAWVLAEKKREDIINEARTQSEKILTSAKTKAEMLESDLERNFTDWVKRTSLLVVKKLLQKDKNLKDDYLDSAIQEVVSEK